LARLSSISVGSHKTNWLESTLPMRCQRHSLCLHASCVTYVVDYSTKIGIGLFSDVYKLQRMRRRSPRVRARSGHCEVHERPKALRGEPEGPLWLFACLFCTRRTGAGGSPKEAAGTTLGHGAGGVNLVGEQIHICVDDLLHRLVFIRAPQLRV